MNSKNEKMNVNLMSGFVLKRMLWVYAIWLSAFCQFRGKKPFPENEDTHLSTKKSTFQQKKIEKNPDAHGHLNFQKFLKDYPQSNDLLVSIWLLENHIQAEWPYNFVLLRSHCVMGINYHYLWYFWWVRNQIKIIIIQEKKHKFRG